MKKIITVLALSLSLQSCVFVAGAAAGAAAAAMIYDHRKIEQIASDQRINNEIVARINAVPGMLENSHINVNTFNHVVLLTGEATTPDFRQKADTEAHSVSGANRIYNMIAVKGPSSALTRTSDSWITAKIKTQLLADKNLKSGSIKVVTEDGVVFLMGNVTPEQADTAVEISRQVSGVQKVVRVFQFKKPTVTQTDNDQVVYSQTQ